MQAIKFLWESETRGRAFVPDNSLRAKGGSKITGHAAVFNQLSEDLGGYRERISPGAFSDSIKSSDIRALWNHDTNLVLGRNTAGTLKLEEDATGLATEYDFPDTGYARDLLNLIARGDVTQQSFGFMVLPGGAKWNMEDGGLVRTLLNVELFDVSPVTYPAYKQTDIQARAQAELRSLAAAKLKELASEVDPDKVKAELEARAKARRELIARLTPKPDRLSYPEILKSCQVKA